MFRNSIKLILLISISVLLVGSTISAQNQQGDNRDLAKIRKEISPFVVQLIIKVPMREGRDAASSASGVAIYKTESEAQDAFGNIDKYATYYILSVIHIAGEKENDLRDYQNNGTRIFVLGKKTQAPVKIVAWEWGSEALLLSVDIAEKDLNDFKIEVAHFAKKLPVSLSESRYSGNPDDEPENIFLAGYPYVTPVVNTGYVSKYVCNFDFNDYTSLVKIAVVDVMGFEGQGQSGGGVFNQNKELIGLVFGGLYAAGGNLAYVIPIDIVMERFLKKLFEFSGLNLPNFILEDQIKNKPIFLGRPN